MFLHVFINMFKCLVRDKQNIIWLMLFPIVLGTLFKVAIPDATVSTKFNFIDIAVVDNEEYQNNVSFKFALDSVISNKNNKDAMFNAEFVDENKAEDLLKNDKIKGYIIVSDQPKVIVKETGIGQTILKEFVSNYLQYEVKFKNILTENPNALDNLISETNNNKSYLKEVKPSDKSPNNTLTYYYALITMTALYGGFLGLRVVTELQANQSSKGARVNLAAVSKLKLFGYSIVSAISLQIIIMFVLLGYLNFVLNISFGDQILYVVIATIISSFVGVTFGAALSAVVKGSENSKLSILLAVSMVMSFLSGLMWPSIKYIVASKVPILSYINFGNLIADTFYSLYYYDTYTRYFTNIGVLLGFSMLFSIIVFFVMRRQKYESI